jgi:hypothetical protein
MTTMTATNQFESDYLKQQLRRRDLSLYERAEFAWRLKVLRPDLSRVELSEIGQLGEKTLYRAQRIMQHAPDSIKDQLRRGTMTIRHAFTNLSQAPVEPTEVIPAPVLVAPIMTKRTHITPKPKPSDLSYADDIRREVRQRIEGACDRALTLEEWAKHWGVHTDIARRYLREALMVGSVTRERNRYTITLSSEIVELTKLFRNLRTEITNRRKAMHDKRGASRWNPYEVNVAAQHDLLNWIEAQLDKTSLL